MKVSAIFLAAATVPAVTAVSCTKGLNYCGRALRYNGLYPPAWNAIPIFCLIFQSWSNGPLIDALEAAGVSPTNGAVAFSLFRCLGDAKIEFYRRCGDLNCGNGGAGKSDFCT
ncbi:hypothetical protein NOR_06691 [Metarhizium rileyi]|uniref:Uncharacterized protein n=1 Tax=Metarhizium rileyi (strain RCEF 4871) TaxID=1649241 RepID=A0A166ZW55_METRR|nr:hypothetical protein NOR_06691 [Metarhizium rileyi RCEF 4871]